MAQVDLFDGSEEGLSSSNAESTVTGEDGASGQARRCRVHQTRLVEVREPATRAEGKVLAKARREAELQKRAHRLTGWLRFLRCARCGKTWCTAEVSG